MKKLSFAYFETPVGRIMAGSNDLGIALLIFDDHQKKPGWLSDGSIQLVEKETPFLIQLHSELKEYFAGKRREFSVPLAPHGTTFQQGVWQELQNTPYGTTRSYLDQAKRLNGPSSVRAVASANGKNPISIIIPCHRIIGSNGKLTGYAGGLWRKKWLLNHEAEHVGQTSSLF